jgi:hypothetical protein
MKKFMLISAICTLVILIANSGMTAAWPPSGFTEQTADQNTTFPATVATDVAVLAPLPKSFPSHPAACDTLHFLRIHHVNGPVNPSNADAILIAQPGILEGASAFYNVAANLVTRAHNEKGKFVEFWAIDRRSNCLEDNNGIRLARSTGNPYDFIDYYYRHKAYKGQKFNGFLNPNKDAKWLAEMGMAQTVIDWNEIVMRGIPSQSVRQQKVYLGGHSLGGFITGAYASWDFGGKKLATDAGYNQCAGFFGLDTTVTAEPMDPISATSLLISVLGTSVYGSLFPNGLGANADSVLASTINSTIVALLRSGSLERFVSVPGIINPEIMNLLTGIGMIAAVQPTAESKAISYLPANLNVNLCERFYESQNMDDFLALKPKLTKIRYTNQALLGVFMDNDSMPFFFIKTGVGFFTGGSVADKDFPFSAAEASTDPTLAMMFGTKPLAIPTEENGPLYGWLNYNQIPGATIPNSSLGTPYTDASVEVTDINDLARSVGALPLNFTEYHFPIRLAVDPSIGGYSGLVYADGPSKRPILNIKAGESPMVSALTPGEPVIAGYHHLDVLTAAPVQNDGMPEGVTTELLNFIFQ